MKYCSSCRYFGTEAGVNCSRWVEDDDGLPLDYEEKTTGHHYCARIIHGNQGGERYEYLQSQLAIVTDGSGYAARLRVLPNFGCALHEDRG